eukprot:s1008_g28.t1
MSRIYLPRSKQAGGTTCLQALFSLTVLARAKACKTVAVPFLRGEWPENCWQSRGLGSAQVEQKRESGGSSCCGPRIKVPGQVSARVVRSRFLPPLPSTTRLNRTVLNASFPPARWLSLKAARGRPTTRSYGYAGKTSSPTATSAAASDWGSLLVRRARALARRAAHPSDTSTGQACPSAVLATACCAATASMPHQRRDQPAAATQGRAGGALCDRMRSRCCAKRPAALADLRAQNDELLRSSAAELRVCGPFPALGCPEHGPGADRCLGSKARRARFPAYAKQRQRKTSYKQKAGKRAPAAAARVVPFSLRKIVGRQLLLVGRRGTADELATLEGRSMAVQFGATLQALLRRLRQQHTRQTSRIHQHVTKGGAAPLRLSAPANGNSSSQKGQRAARCHSQHARLSVKGGTLHCRAA